MHKTDTIHIKSIPCSTGIGTYHDQYFSVQPNPSKGIFRVIIENDVQTELIEVFDIHGKSVYSENLSGSVHTLDLSDRAKGIYFVKLLSKNGEIHGTE